MEKRRETLSKNFNRIPLCFKWIYTVLYYSGCVCLKSRKGVFHLTNSNILYTNLIRITLIISFVGSMIMKSSGNRGSIAMMEHLSPVLKLVLAMQFISCAITYTAASILMERNKYQHIKVIERFQQLDNGLKMHFPHINWNYHKTEFKFTVSTLILLFYFCIISCLYLFRISNCMCDYVTTFVLTLSYVTLTTGPGFITFLHIGIMDLQRIRYRLIQKLLKQHYAKRSTKFKNERDDTFQLQILCLIDYFKNYVQLILKINDLFSIACGLILFHDFALLTFLTYLMCQLATDTDPKIEKYIFLFLFMIIPIYKQSMYAVYGYMVYKEQQNSIHEIRICEDYCRRSKSVRNHLKSFLHWKMQNSYTFLIGKATRCDLTVLYMAVNSIAASTMILIQLQFQQNSITKRVDNCE